MKKLALLTAIGIVTAAVLVSCAGAAFESFANSVDMSKGTVGCVNAK